MANVWDEDTSRVTTLKLTKNEFARLDTKSIPKGWKYIQTKDGNNIVSHSLQKRWTLNFKKYIEENRLSNKEVMNFGMGNCAIYLQRIQEAQCRVDIGMTKGTQAEKLAKSVTIARNIEHQRNAEALVANKVCKTIQEALKMLVIPVVEEEKKETPKK